MKPARWKQYNLKRMLVINDGVQLVYCLTSWNGGALWDASHQLAVIRFIDRYMFPKWRFSLLWELHVIELLKHCIFSIVSPIVRMCRSDACLLNRETNYKWNVHLVRRCDCILFSFYIFYKETKPMVYTVLSLHFPQFQQGMYFPVCIPAEAFLTADYLRCLFIMDFHYCTEWTCMGIKVTKETCVQRLALRCQRKEDRSRFLYSVCVITEYILLFKVIYYLTTLCSRNMLGNALQRYKNIIIQCM